MPESSDIVHIVIQGGVVVGVFDTDSAANEFRASLPEAAKVDSWVVARGPTERPIVKKQARYEVRDDVLFDDGIDKGRGIIDHINDRTKTYAVYRIRDEDGRIFWMLGEEILGIFSETA